MSIGVRSARLAVAAVVLAGLAPLGGARADAVRYRDPIFPSVDVVSDVAYGSAVNNLGEQQVLLLDLYSPSGDVVRDRPALIWVHGGGFKTGSKASGRGTATAFAQRGYVTASIDYRLRPTGTPGSSTNQELIAQMALGEPSQIADARHDLLAAVRWFRANAEALGVDPARIVAGGGSAGAVTALGANFRSEDAGDSGNPSYDSSIAAAISVSGAWDPREISPGDGPIIMFHGTNDVVVPFGLAASTCGAHLALTNLCEPHVYPGEGHGLGTEHNDEMRVAMADFLCRYVVAC